MSKRAREESRAARAAAALAEQQRAERRRQFLVVGGVLVVLVLVAGGLFWFTSNQDTAGETPDAVPAHTTKEYGVVVGDDSAPTTLVLYEDFQCPTCGALEDATADQVNAAIDAGKVKVEYRMVSFLDRASANEYSSRAANAAMAVLDTAGVDAFKRFHDELYANQPEEGTAGPENSQLIDMAVQAGADKSKVSGPIEDGSYDQWIVNATDSMSRAGVTGTPGVFIDGKQVAGNKDPAEAVLAAIK